MTREEYEKAINEIYPLTDSVYLHVLGEPLLHPEIFDFIRIANEKGLKVTVTTNATLLKALGEELISSGVYKVQISLHSFEEGKLGEYLETVCDFSAKSQRFAITFKNGWKQCSVEHI